MTSRARAGTGTAPKRARRAGAKPWRSVAFAGDCLRFSVVGDGARWSQRPNVSWLHELVGTLGLWRERDVRVVLHTPDALLRTLAMSGAATWRDYVADAEAAWARRYDTEDSAAIGAFEPLFDDLAAHDLVIGFELPPTFKRRLHRDGRAYLNFCVHPTRFLRDLALGATTNTPALAERLRVLAVPARETDVQLRRFRAMFAKQAPAAVALPAGLPLLAGQTERDSVLIRNGRFADWPDHADAVAQQLAPYPELVFLEHPMRASSDAIVHFLRDRLGKTVVATNANAYGALFADAPPPLLLTLASSLGVEALAAGVPAHFLLDDPRRKLRADGVDIDEMFMVGHDVLRDGFWQALLDDAPPAAALPDPFSLGEHYLRDSLGAWAYRPLRQGLDGLSSRKKLVPAAALADERRDELLARLAGVPEPVRLAPAAAIAAARQVSVDLQLAAAPLPPLRPGMQCHAVLAGEDARPLLAQGFHAPESWGCWSSALRCMLQCPVATDIGPARLHLRLPVRLFDGLLPHMPVLRVSQAGRTLAYVFFRPGSANPVEIEIDAEAVAPLTAIDFELSRLGAPQALGNDDRRWLGIALTGLQLRCEAAAGDDSPAGRLFGIGPEPGLLPRPGRLTAATTP